MSELQESGQLNPEGNAIDETSEHAMQRRHFLEVATSTMAAAGIAAFAYPLIDSLQPSAKARERGGPVIFDPSRLAAGEQKSIMWRGRPVLILHRTKEEVTELSSPELNQHLRDPESKDSTQPAYARGATRSIRPELFVCVGTCTHLGCIPLLRPSPDSLGAQQYWPGGYFCPCHGSKFDLAGRVFDHVPAPTNLVIPPYRFTNAGRIEIGVDAAIPKPG